MAKKFLTDIDLSKNELMNAVMHRLTTAPQNPVMGQLYYNTGDMMMYQYDGAEWKPVGRLYTNGSGIVLSANTFSADFATNAEATAGTSTVKVMSPALVKAVIQTLDVAGFAMGMLSANGDNVTIHGLKETDGKIAVDTSKQLVIKIDSAHPYDADDNHLATEGTVSAAKQAAAVTVEAGAESATNFVSYTVKQGGAAVGTINIPKFLVVKSGSVVTGTWNGSTFTEDATQPGSGTGKAIKLVLNDSGDAGTADDVLYINVADLVDVYTGGNGITISTANVVSVKLDTDKTNGLSLSSNGLALDTASQSAAGAMSAADKAKLDGITAGAEPNRTYTVVTGKPTANQTPGFGSTFTVSQINQDATGQVTATDRTVKIPNAAATQSAAGLMSATDKTILDGLNSLAVNMAHRYKVTNPALTPSGGICTWTIPSTSFGNDDGTFATCTLRDSTGNEVVADVKYETNTITIKINSATTIAAGAYIAIIIQ